MLQRKVKERYHPYQKGPRPKETTRPLYFFYDSETTGSSPLTTEILEIAATVACSEEIRTFSRLVKTNQQSSFAAFRIHHITNDDVQDKANFPEVFEAFRKWVISTREDFSRMDHVTYNTVLVAHNGYSFDFRVLLSEIERHELDSSWFNLHNVKFADSLKYLRQVKKGVSISDELGLSLESLYMKFFPNEEYKGHRALPDAENLQKLFTQSPLNRLLESMPSISYHQQLLGYQLARDKREMQDVFDITPQQAQRLAELRLSTDILERVYGNTTSDEEFDGFIHRIGVNSKTVREKLLAHLST